MCSLEHLRQMTYSSNEVQRLQVWLLWQVVLCKCASSTLTDITHWLISTSQWTTHAIDNKLNNRIHVSPIYHNPKNKTFILLCLIFPRKQGYDFTFLRRSRLFEECSSATQDKWTTQFIGGNRLAICESKSWKHYTFCLNLTILWRNILGLLLPM